MVSAGFARAGTVSNVKFSPRPHDRGYVLINATLDGVPIQFVSTHLDETHSQAKPAEVTEILAALGNSGEPQLVVGDFNAAPNDSCGGLPCDPAEMLAAGFVDTAAAAGALGPTCCQLPSLDNNGLRIEHTSAIAPRLTRLLLTIRRCGSRDPMG